MDASLRIYAREEDMRLYFKDMGSFCIGFYTVVLHLNGGSVTAADLSAICESAGICSRGRVETLVSKMKSRRDLMAERVPGGGRARRLVPSERLVTLFRDYMAGHVAGWVELETPAVFVASRLCEPGCGEPLLRMIGALALMDLGRPRRYSDVINFFAYRSAGMNILFDISAGMPEAPLAGTAFNVSISDISRKFGVSRAHVLDLLHDGAEAGHLNWQSEERTVTFGEDLAEAQKGFFTVAFASIEAVAREVAATG